MVYHYTYDILGSEFLGRCIKSNARLLRAALAQDSPQQDVHIPDTHRPVQYSTETENIGSANKGEGGGCALFSRHDARVTA